MKKSIVTVVAPLLTCAASLFPVAARAADNGYHVLATYKLTGPGKVGSVALDSEARRLYVVRGDHVDVLNADTGAKVGSVAAENAKDIVLAPEGKHGFITGESVTMFDLPTLKVAKKIKLSLQSPNALAYDADAGRIFVAANGAVGAIDSNSGEIVGSVPLEGQLGHLVSNGYGRLFVAAQDKNVIHVVDTGALKFLGDFPIGGGSGPTGVALDPSGRRLFVACTNGRLPVIDTDIGFTFQELPIGTGSAGDVFTFTPQGKGGWRGAVFVASGDGTLSLVRMNAFINYSHAGEVKIQPGIQSLAFDSKTHKIFVPASSNGAEVLVVGQ